MTSHKCAKVAVVLSSYNGSKYLRQQIDSILSQKMPQGCSIELFIRDDGSSDQTPALLAEYRDRPDVHLWLEQNIGVVESFLTLIGLVGDDYDYISLSDQDDVWHPDKISRALEKLHDVSQDIPALYASEYIFCDEHLRRTGVSRLNKTGVDFSKMMFENVVSGNTVVINRRLADLVKRGGSDRVYCHDWWIALLAAATGVLIYDDYPCLDYRRTGSNASATGSGAVQILKNRIQRFISGDELKLISKQLEKLSDEFDDCLLPEVRHELKLMVGGGHVCKALYAKRLRQTISSELLVRIMLMIGAL